MDRQTIFTKTAKGLLEATGKTSALPRDLRNILKEVDGKANVAQIAENIGKMPEPKLLEALAKIEREGYVREFVRTQQTAAQSAPSAAQGSGEDLDFTSMSSAPAGRGEEKAGTPDAAAARASEDAAVKARLEAAMRAKAQAAVKGKLEAEAKAKADADAKVRAEAEARARLAAQQKAKADAEAKAKAEAEAQARLAAEQKAKAAAEARARAEAEARAKKEADEKARREAEHRARREAEEKARREAAERARREAEEKARKELEERKRVESELTTRLEEERRAREEVERRSQEDAQRIAREAEDRGRRETEEKARRESEDLRAQLDAERKAREQAEQRARDETERRERGEAERKLREESERKAKEDADRKAREESDRAAREAAESAQREAEALRAQIEAERKAREEAERKAKEEAEARANAEAEARAREEEVRRAKDEAERKAREEAERKVKEEAERKAKEDAERKAKEEAERRAKEEAERKAKEEAERQAKEEAERKAKEEAERKAKEEAERRAKEEAERKAKEEAERKAKEEAERAAKEETERKAREEAESKGREEAERRRRDEAERKAQEESDAVAKARDDARALELARAKDDARSVKEEKERTASELEEQRSRERDAEEEEKDASPGRAKLEAEAAAQARREARARERALGSERQDVADEQPASRAEPGPGTEAQVPRLRKQRNWARLISLTLFIVLVAALAVIHVMPLDVAPYEKATQERLGEPVRIGSIRFSLIPRPHLTFEKVNIGTEPKLQIRLITAVPEFGSMFAPRKVLRSMEIEGLGLSGSFASRALWGKGSDESLRIDRLVAKQVKFEIDGMALPPLDVEASLGPAGLETAQLSHAPSGLTISVQPAGGKAVVEISAKQLALPFAEKIVLGEFSGKGTLSALDLTLSEFEGRVFDGRLSGNARLSWRDGWSFEGEVAAKGMDAEKLAAPTLSSGRMDGKGVFGMKAPVPDKLMATARIEGSFNIQKGTVANVDFARLLQGSTVGGGSTLFSEMTGTFVADPNRMQFRQLRLAAGLLSATATADVEAQKNVTGRMQIELRSQAAQARATLAISGTLAEPQFRRSN